LYCRLDNDFVLGVSAWLAIAGSEHLTDSDKGVRASCWFRKPAPALKRHGPVQAWIKLLLD